jgi:ankyrin repeat protein
MKKITRKVRVGLLVILVAGIVVVAFNNSYLSNGVGEREQGLMEAATFGDRSKVSELIRTGANVDAKAHSPFNLGRSSVDDGLTPLFYAVSNRKTEVVRLLLENGANPNIATDADNVPLLIAASSGDPEIVSLLLKYKASPDHQNSVGDTPISLARRRAEHSPEHREVVRLLMTAGAR